MFERGNYWAPGQIMGVAGVISSFLDGLFGLTPLACLYIKIKIYRI